MVAAVERIIAAMARDYAIETRHGLPRQWQNFFAAAPDIGNAVPGVVHGASFSADGRGGFRHAVGVEVSEPPATMPPGFWPVFLGGGTHAVMRRFGPVSDLPRVMDWMFGEWQETSGWRQREGAVFERHPDDPRNGEAGLAFEIWMPVAAAPKTG